MKQLALCLLLSLFQLFAYGQTTVEDYIKQGIEYHDSGQYDKAIESYMAALKIDPKSPLVNYELSLSYFQAGDYDSTIKYADAVLKQKSDYLLEAYITKGSALDNQGKVKKAIKLFERGIQDTGGHFLLYYNLGLTHLKAGQAEEAEANILKAVDDNPNHASSHLMLANIHHTRGQKVQTLLATYFFLLLEPNTSRSVGAYEMLQANFNGGVEKNPDEPNSININLLMGEKSEFQSAELMISMLAATALSDENKDKTEEELFIENTESFFNIMGELNNGKNDNIWWNTYVPFLYSIAESEHLATYCYYITHYVNPKANDWLNENEDKLQAFGAWMEED